MATFKNLKDLMTKFADEQVCRDFLVKHRWNGQPVCPYCGCNRSYKIENGKRFKCANKECHKKYSVTVGTIAEDSNIKLSTWFAALYLVSAHKKGISSIQLGKDLGIAQKTAWFMIHRIREALRNKKGLLLTKEVQADETYMGGADKNRHESKKHHTMGKSDDKTPIVGLIETGGRVVTKVMPWVSKKNVTELIDQNLAKGTQLVSDSNPVYYKVGKRYQHVIVNHSAGQYTVDRFHTNSIENYWSVLKRTIYGTYHQVSRKHLSRYCDESAFRFNSRKMKDNDRFELTLQQLEGRLTYAQLISNDNHGEQENFYQQETGE